MKHEPQEADLSPVETNDKGVVILPKSRLSSAGKLRSIHSRFCEDDRASERNRAKVQNLKDYKPPLDKAKLRKAGQGGRFNINFGEVATIVSEASSAYIDTFESPEHLVPIKLVRNKLNPSDKIEYERIMSDELTKLIRGWDGAYFEYMQMVDQFVTHGLAIGFFSDRNTWQWRAGGLSDFKFPRKTRATADAIDICTCEYQIGPAALADIVNDVEAATSAGWNVKAVHRAIAGGRDSLYDDESSEDTQEKEKANDLDDYHSKDSPVTLIYGWVKEYDGTISNYISTKSSIGDEYSNTPDEFLYKADKVYNNFGEVMQLFPFYTGNKGNIYTVRGLGYMVYPQGVASNLMQSSLMDSARDSMSVKYISPSEREINNMPIVNAGPATFIPPHLQIVDKQFHPDLQRSAMPALDMLKQQMSSKSASSSMSSVFNNKQDRRSSVEVSAALEHFNSLNSSAMLLWSRPWRALVTEIARRAFVPDQDETQEYGRLAAVMHKACLDRGVPIEVFGMIDFHETKTSIPVGSGSKAARSAQFEAGGRLYNNMDDAGRQNFDKDEAIHLFGVEFAKRYLNFEDVPREIIDDRIALLENHDLMEGTQIEPSNSEVSTVHLRIHIGKLSEMIEVVESGEMELQEFVAKGEMLYQHAMQTLESAAVPEEQNEELNMYKQKLQQIGEYLNNGIREREKLMREQQEAEAQAPQGGGEEEANAAEQQLKAQNEQLKIQVAQMKAEIDIQKKQTENQLDAEKKSREIEHIDVLHKQKMVQQRAEALQKLKFESEKGKINKK